jgi:hypothetical protein
MRNKKNREKIKTLLDKLKKSGDLSKISTDVNMAKILADDARAFAEAQGLLNRLDKDRARFSGRISAQDPEAIAKGIKGARALAFVIFILTVVMVATQ